MSSDDAKAYINDVEQESYSALERTGNQWAVHESVSRRQLAHVGDQIVLQELGQLHRRDQHAGRRSPITNISAFLNVIPDLMGPLGVKIADEFIHPKPPGHVLVMLQTAEALGLDERSKFCASRCCPSAARFSTSSAQLMWEGTVAEWWFSMLTGRAHQAIGRPCWFQNLDAEIRFH